MILVTSRAGFADDDVDNVIRVSSVYWTIYHVGSWGTTVDYQLRPILSDVVLVLN